VQTKLNVGQPGSSYVLDSLLPADKAERARFVGKVFGDKAIGVDGSWLSEHLSTGSPLEPNLRSEMEEKLGADLSGVRIHTDNNAHLVTQTLNARAFAIGQHIAFANGQFDPDTESGRNLLAHELVHSVQQENVSTIPSRTIPITRPVHSSEREADVVAELVTSRPVGQIDRYVSPVLAPQVSLSVCGVIVEAACWAAFSAIAAAIAALCTIGSVITVGGLAIPCTAIVIASAGLAAWDAVMCTNILKQEICGERITAEASPAGPATEAIA
jgi:hypothetical protein